MNAIIKDIAAHFDAAADLARCTATAQAMLTNGRSLVQADAEAMQFSIEAYEADQRTKPDPSEGRLSDFREMVGELLSMGVSADDIRLTVESALMMATA